VAGALWEAVGVELTIFSLTLVAGFVMHAISFLSGVRLSQRTSRDPLKGHVQLEESSKTRHTSVGANSYLPARSDHHEFALSKRRNSSYAAQGRGSLAIASRKNTHQKPTVVDLILQGARDRPHCSQSSLRVIEMYVSLKKNNFDSVREVIRSAKMPSSSFHTLVIQSVIKANMYELLDEVLQDMKDHGIETTLCLYESIMKQLAGQRQLRLALSIYDRLVADGLEPSAVSYSCLISFAAEVGEAGRAIEFFERLSEVTTPSIRAYMTMLKIYSKMLNWPASLGILRDMQHRGVRVDTLALNVLLGTGVSAGKISEVEALVTEAEMMEPSPLDAVSYNTLMKGYVLQAHAEKAFDVMQRMQRKGLTPSSISFHTAMDAAVRSSHTQASAWELLGMMQAAGLAPDNYTCSILVKGLSREATSSRVRVCLGILQDGMKSCNRLLQGTLYNIVLEARFPLVYFDFFYQRHGSQFSAITFNQ